MDIKVAEMESIEQTNFMDIRADSESNKELVVFVCNFVKH